MRNETVLRMLSGFVLVGVFAAGALFGAGLLRWTQSPSQALPAHPPPGGPVEKMRHELDLDPQQMDALRTIMDKHRPELARVMQETQGKVRDVLFSIEEELRPQLRADQVKRLEQWRAHRPPPPMPGIDGPPPGGPPPGGPQGPGGPP